MKNKFLKGVKTIAVTVLAISIVVIGSVSMPNRVNATETTANVIDSDETTGIQYVKYNSSEYYEACFLSKKSPEYNAVDADGVGYVFGGWYERNEADDPITYTSIQDDTDLAKAKSKDAVVAKFVPAQVLSVKCQNWAGTNETSNEVIVRVISAVDSTNYQNYGFEIMRESEDSETGWKTLETYNSKEHGNKYYSSFHYYKNAEDEQPTKKFGPTDLFGKAASHLTSCTLGYIPISAHGSIICIKPFWETLDGTKVYGLTKYAHVEDGYLNYINVPVNVNFLSNENGVVAGMLNVKSDNRLNLVDVEYGKLFDEMDTNTVTDSEGNIIVRCVGNTSTISKEAEKTSMDIYVNIRFQGQSIEDMQEVPHYTFTVMDEKFCDSEKNILPDDVCDVWNVRY